jgi:hypothetical protein
MALAERLQTANQQYKSGFLCKLMQVTVDPRLSKEDVEAVIKVINSEPSDTNHVPNNRLSLVLREEGFDVSTSAIDRHRRGDCSCNRLKQGDK